MRVLLADDSALVRGGVARVLADAGFEIAGEAGEPTALLGMVRAHQPDLVIVDIRMPPTFTHEGLDAAKSIRAQWPDVGVLVLSQHVEAEAAVQLVSDGRGIGYLLKDRVSDLDEFVAAARRVARGGSAIDPEIVTALLDRPRADSPLHELSPRERDVLELMAQGLSNEAIGARLFLSDRTVETHVSSIFTKLSLPPSPQANRRVQAVLVYLNG